MEALTRIIFVDEKREKFFGEGPYRLLLAVEETGSLHKAAQSMGMAYTKALKLVRQAEEALGFPFLERMTGGVSGGGSRLTAKGKEWMERYEGYRNACVEANRELYLDFFSK